MFSEIKKILSLGLICSLFFAAELKAQEVVTEYYQLEGLFVDEAASSVEVFYSDEIDEKIKYAIKTGDLKTQYTLGYMYQYGKGVSIDEKRAEKWYKNGSKSGYVPSMVALAKLYKSGGDGIFRNVNKALSLFRKAAKKGSADAWYEIGVMYENGIGTYASDKNAFDAYKKAAKGGSLNANVKLGMFYQYGRGTKQSIRKAIRHFNILDSKSNNPNVKRHIASLLGGVYYDIAIKQEKLADRYDWYLLAAEHGDVKSILAVADGYRDGKGVVQDYNKAIEYYMSVVGRGSIYAMLNLGYIYSNGLGVERDYKEAMRWYEQATEVGSPDAAWQVGSMYFYGRGAIEQDYEAARKWFRRSKVLANRELGGKKKKRRSR